MWSPLDLTQFDCESFNPWGSEPTGKLIDEWRKKRKPSTVVNDWLMYKGCKVKSSRQSGTKAVRAMELRRLKSIINEASKPALRWG